MKRSLIFALALSSSLLLSGCATVLVGATAVGIASASDARTVGAQVDDQAIEMKAVAALRDDSRLKEVRIQVVSFNRSVLLMGQVEHERLRSYAGELIGKVDGVVRVHNEIRVGEVIGLGQQSKDTWITSKVKTQLLASENVEGSRIKVVTEAGEVFLLGLVSSDDANTAVEIARNVNSVVRVIDAFEIRN